MKLKEWQWHVVKDLSNPLGVSYCGVQLGSTSFGLQGAEHALLCVEKETRLQPCPACLKIIQAEASE